MFQRYRIQRDIGSISATQYKEQVLNWYYRHSANMTGETLMSITTENESLSGPAQIVHLQASYVLAADLERAQSRYFVSGRRDGSIAVHDLHSTTLQTIGPVTRKVFPSVLNIREPTHTIPVSKVEWYPGDYGHFSSSSRDVLKLWDPNKGQVMETFTFDEGVIRDHSSSAHQPLIAVAHRKEIRLIDLRTGYTGQKFQRPRSGLDRVRNCCHNDIRPLMTSSSAGTSSSGKRSRVPIFARKSEKHHSYPPTSQKSPLNSPMSSSASSRSLSGVPPTPTPNLNFRNSPTCPYIKSPSRENPSLLGHSTQTKNVGLSHPWAVEVQRRQVSQATALGNNFGSDYRDDVSCVCFHPTMPSALSAGYIDGDIVMWDVRSSRSYLFNLMDHYPKDAPLPHASAVRGLRYSSDGRHLVSFNRFSVLLWDGYTAEPVGDTVPFVGNSLKKTNMHFDIGDVKISAASKSVFVCLGTGVHTFDLPSGTEIAHFRGHMKPIRGLVIDHTQHRLFTYGDDAHFITWSFHMKEPFLNVRKNDPSESLTDRNTRRERQNDDWSTDEEND